MAKKAVKKRTKIISAVKRLAEEESLPQTSTRRLKTAKHRSFRLESKIKPSKFELPGAFTLQFKAINLVVKNWKLFGGLTLVYLVCSALFIQYQNLFDDGTTLNSTKSALDLGYHGGIAFFGYASTLFLSMVSGIVRNNNSSSTGVQFILVLLGSLAVIWAIRKSYGEHKNKIRIRDALYNGMAPLVPFILILVTVGIELIPATVGIFLYATIANNGIAANDAEKTLWVGIMGLTVLLSLYLVSSSVFALYISTLDGMEPMRALKSARSLVRYRRWTVMRKVLFMPVGLLLIAAIVMTPFLVITTKYSPLVFYILSVLALPLAHSYMYCLYRELLNE